MLAGLAAGFVRGTVALGRPRGARLRRLGHPREAVEAPTPSLCHAQWKGCDLHARLVVPAGQRERLERVCRYVLRPPVGAERIAVTGEGEVRRINLILYYGVLGARAAWRPAVVRRPPSDPDAAAGVPEGPAAPACAADSRDTARCRAGGQRWADLMRRTFGFDVLACPRCGGRLRLIALIEEAAVIGRILGHLGLPTEPPVPRPARAPPLAEGLPGVAGQPDEPLDVRAVLLTDGRVSARRRCAFDGGAGTHRTEPSVRGAPHPAPDRPSSTITSVR